MKPLVCCLIFLCAVLAGLPAAAAPSADTSAAAWLTRARVAAGGAAWSRTAALKASGSVRTSGLPGTWSRTDDLRQGRFRHAIDVGVSRIAEGNDGTTHWRQDPSGGVHALDSAFARRATLTDAWLIRRGWLNAGADRTSLGPLVERTDASRRYMVVEATPLGGESVTLWFDAATRLLDRTVRTMPISVDTVRYADYRRVNGLQLPFVIESRSTGSSDVETVRVQRWQTLPAQTAQRFTAPAPPDDTRLEGETRVPLEIDGMLVVRATLNGHAFDFILDTGGHNILTPAAAQALGIEPVGEGTSGGAGPGLMTQQYTRIARLQIGDAVMLDQHFYVLPFSYATVERGTREPLAGLLGLEIFERFGVRIDYPAKTLTLRKLAGYTHQGAGTPVPISFDDDMPQLPGIIDGIPGVFALDTGNAGPTLIQPLWAGRHGMAERMKRDGIETVSYGAGGASTNWASRIDSIELGGQRITRPIVRYAEDRAGAFSSRTEAANIGTDALAHFVLDVDYARGTVWFEHKPGYRQAPFNRSGLRAIKEGPAAFRVVVVSPGSPAHAAGFERGDEIVAVDAVPAEQLSGRQLGKALTREVGTTLSFTVRRNAAERQLSLRLVELLP